MNKQNIHIRTDIRANTKTYSITRQHMQTTLPRQTINTNKVQDSKIPISSTHPDPIYSLNHQHIPLYRSFTHQYPTNIRLF